MAGMDLLWYSDWIARLEVKLGVFRGEPQFHAHGFAVPTRLPRLDLGVRFGIRRARHCRTMVPVSDLRHVQPAAVLWRVVDLQPFGEVRRASGGSNAS